MQNVYPNQQFLLRFWCMETEETLFEFAAQAGADSNPLENYIMILPTPPLPLPTPGRYAFSALHNGFTFAECVVTVRDVTPPRESVQ
jgi:hypothetical protein